MTLADIFDIADDARALGRDVAAILAQAGGAAVWFEVLRPPAKRMLLLARPRSQTTLASFDAILKKRYPSHAVDALAYSRHPLLRRT